MFYVFFFLDISLPTVWFFSLLFFFFCPPRGLLLGWWALISMILLDDWAPDLVVGLLSDDFVGCLFLDGWFVVRFPFDLFFLGRCWCLFDLLDLFSSPSSLFIFSWDDYFALVCVFLFYIFFLSHARYRYRSRSIEGYALYTTRFDRKRIAFGYSFT